MNKLTGKGKPFHSALDKAAALLKRKVGTGAEFMQELKGLGGIKQAEIDERKLADLMGMPKMTHEQFMAALADRPMPAIYENVFGESAPKEEVIKAINNNIKYYASNYAKDNSDFPRGSKEYRALLSDEIKRLRKEEKKQIEEDIRQDLETPTSHEYYTLPGGENYREMLIKSPEGEPMYQGKMEHFEGEPGILASMRLKDRVGPNGEKLLHLEELQSDWHQAGREHGYQKPKIPYLTELPPEFAVVPNQHATHPNHEKFNVVNKETGLHSGYGGMTEEDAIAKWLASENRGIDYQNEINPYQPPEGPFKKNWEEVALKRLLHHAAEKGYHGIVMTPGEEQAKRYGQSAVAEAASYHPDDRGRGNYLNLFGKGNEFISSKITPEDKLANAIGEEAAKRLLAQTPIDDTRVLNDLNVDVGAMPMKAFYDKKLPNILNAIGKKHKVKTKLHGHTLAHPKEDLPAINEANAVRAQHGHPPVHQATLHHFPITEEMRKDILTNGLPLYADGGIIKKAQGGTVLPTLEQMKMELMKKAKPDFNDLRNIGINEAPGLNIKAYVPPSHDGGGPFPVGGVSMDGQPLPMGGVDLNKAQPGNQLMPANLAQPAQQAPQGMPPGAPSPLGGVDTNAPAPQGGSNILQLTPQGQAMSAMKPPAMASGGSVPQMPINNYPFQLADHKPYPFLAKEGGSDNRPMDNQSMDNGATTFNIDNIQELASGGDVQGYASKGYVLHEPKKPHPDVGTRYKATQLPGLLPEHPVDLEQLYKDRASIQLRPWDATNRHVNVTNVSGHDLLNPLTTEGGQPFARDVELSKKGIVSASNEGIQRKIQGRANTAHEENIKQGGHGHTYDIISTMDAPAPFFTHMPLHIQLDLLKQRQLKKDQLKELADKVRAIPKRDTKTKKITYPYANMLPLDHPELWDQMMKGGHGIGAPGKLRTALSATLGQVAQQKLLDYNLPDLMNAITDEEIRKAPATYAGNTFLANIPYADVGPQHHTIYDKSGYGEYGGKGPQMPAEFYMTDVYDRVLAEMQKKHPKAGASALRALTIGALQTRAGGVSQMVNDRVLRNAERFTKDVKSGEIADPHDLWNVIGHFHKKYGGYKKGGAVKDAKGGKLKMSDNMDTINLELLNKRKKAK